MTSRPEFSMYCNFHATVLCKLLENLQTVLSHLLCNCCIPADSSLQICSPCICLGESFMQ